jgi:hypothetical protein
MAIVTGLLAGGCVFTLLAQNYYTTEELLECDSLVRAVEREHTLPSLRRLVESGVASDGPVIACGHEHYGLLATRYARVMVWGIVDGRVQDVILSTLRDERQRLAEPHPLIVRFYEAENWVVYRNVVGEIYGGGRGPEKLLRKAFVK